MIVKHDTQSSESVVNNVDPRDSIPIANGTQMTRQNVVQWLERRINNKGGLDICIKLPVK